MVRAVLEATLEELAIAGYGALSMEAVAARAGVAKTTVYRRWATRADLVRAALTARAASGLLTPDTGSLRGDLAEYYASLSRQMSSTLGRSLLRVVLAERSEPELTELVQHVRAERKKVPRGLVRRAIARGALPAHTDVGFLLDTLGGILHYRVAFLGHALSRGTLLVLIDRAIAGAAADLREATPAAKPGARASRASRVSASPIASCTSPAPRGARSRRPSGSPG